MSTGADTSRVAGQAAAGGQSFPAPQNPVPSSKPRTPASRDTEHGTRILERRHQQAKKVLIIDDTPDIRMIIAESLNLFGFETLTAENGLSGVQLAEQERPDLAI